jgi:ethanolamine utilization protein EutJ
VYMTDLSDLEFYLTLANSVILHTSQSADALPLTSPPRTPLKIGVDLGTAYLMVAVLDANNTPLAGEWQFAQVARDGLIVDFIGAVDLLHGMKHRLERRLGCELAHAASGYPPGVPLAEVRATANVLEAAGFQCTNLTDEPSAANLILNKQNGVVVDVGGGTTGIAVIEDGKVVYTADEPTGGTHFSLVIAGALGMTFEEAEALKVQNTEHTRLFPLIRPVMEKVASITSRHIRDRNVDSITLVGGTAAFKGIANVVEEYTGIPTAVPIFPASITPLGLAMSDRLE